MLIGYQHPFMPVGLCSVRGGVLAVQSLLSPVYKVMLSPALVGCYLVSEMSKKANADGIVAASGNEDRTVGTSVRSPRFCPILVPYFLICENCCKSI